MQERCELRCERCGRCERATGANSAVVHHLTTICSQTIQKALEFFPVEHATLFGGIEGVDDGVGFVAVLPEKTPRHALLSAPCDARGAERGVARDIYVMPSPA